jgi:hypothetical protein
MKMGGIIGLWPFAFHFENLTLREPQCVYFENLSVRISRKNPTMKPKKSYFAPLKAAKQ